MKKLLLVLLIFLCILAFPYEKAKAARQQKGRAISLRVLQKIAKKCVSKQKCPYNLLYLCGIKKVLGYVIDEKNKDIILIGIVDKTSPPLYLDDFVVALRNAYFKYAKLIGYVYYYSNPGCSIDPDSKVLKKLDKIGKKIYSYTSLEEVQDFLKNWHKVCHEPQKVSVFGIPFDTHFAKVMVEADYYMKRIVDGSVNLKIKDFKSLTDIIFDIIRKDIIQGKPPSVPISFMNRFWFYPGEIKFHESKGIAYITQVEVRLLTEEQFLTRRGEIRGKGKANPLAEKFARSFTAKYSEIAKIKPIYAELEGLFRFVALAKLMKFKDVILESGLSLDYLLEEYPVKRVPVNRKLPGVSNVKDFIYKKEFTGGYRKSYLCIPSCGGVSIDIKVDSHMIIKDNTGKLFKLKKLILKTRPSFEALFWDFLLKDEFGKFL